METGTILDIARPINAMGIKEILSSLASNLNMEDASSKAVYSRVLELFIKSGGFFNYEFNNRITKDLCTLGELLDNPDYLSGLDIDKNSLIQEIAEKLRLIGEFFISLTTETGKNETLQYIISNKALFGFDDNDIKRITESLDKIENTGTNIHFTKERIYINMNIIKGLTALSQKLLKTTAKGGEFTDDDKNSLLGEMIDLRGKLILD